MTRGKLHTDINCGPAPPAGCDVMTPGKLPMWNLLWKFSNRERTGARGKLEKKKGGIRPLES